MRLYKSGRSKFTLLRVLPPDAKSPDTIHGEVRFKDGTERVMTLGTTAPFSKQLRQTFSFGLSK